MIRLSTRRLVVGAAATLLAIALALSLGVVPLLSVAQTPGGEPGLEAAQAQCPDQYEPNETFQQALLLQPGSIQSYVCAPDKTGQDVDYFRFVAQAGDQIVLTLDQLPADYNICLYDTKQFVLACSSGSGTKAEQLTRTAQQSGYHFAYIYGWQGLYSSTDPYRLTLQVKRPTTVPSSTPTRTRTATPTRTRTATPTATRAASVTATAEPACPDPYEDNGKCEEAWPLGDGEVYPYICDALDEDWFAIDLLLRQEVSITLLDLPKNYELALYNPVGTRVGLSTNADLATEVIDFGASELAGKYCIKVWGAGGAFDPAHTYTLKIGLGDPPDPTPTRVPTATPPPTPTCLPDAYEPNDSRGAASAIVAGSDVVAQLCPRGDNDYYAVAVSSCTQIDVLLSDLPDNYSLALIDPAGTTIGRAGGVGTGDRSLSRIATIDGTYIVRVYPGAGADSALPYRLRVDLSAAEPVTLYPSRDASIFAGSAGSNYGGERTLLVGSDEFGQEYRSLLRFDVSDVAYDTVTSAYLVLHLDAYTGHDTPNIALRKVLSSWSEGSLTWSSMPANIPIGVQTAVGPMAGTDYIWDVTDLVDDWVSGAAANYGLELRYASAAPGSWRAFSSREFGSHQPRLIVGCAPAGGTGSASISGALYHDVDRDGTRDAGDDGVPDVRIELIRRDLGRVDGTTTAADGSYSFGAVPVVGGSTTYEVTVDETSIDMLETWQWLSGPVYSVYASDGSVFDGVDLRVALRPTPTPRPTPSIDFTAEDMELIQVLADEPLVKGKATLARVYVGLTGAAGPVEVSGRLFHGTDSIRPLRPAMVINSTFANPKDDPLVRDNLDRTLNFLLPTAWTYIDDLHLTAHVNWATPGDECGGCWNSENQFTPHPDVHFRDTSAYRVTMIEITADGVAPTASRGETVRYLERVFPINRVNVFVDTMTVTGLDFSDKSGSGCGTGWGGLLDMLDDVEVFGSAGDDSEERLYGMLHESVNDPNGYGGCGRRPGNVAAGITTPGSDGGGVTMAHETGHNLGLRHTCCAGEADCDTYRPGATLGRYGLDMSTPTSPLLLSESGHHDLMSYCGPRWPADHTYSYLLNSFTGHPGVSGLTVDLGVQGDYLVAAGSIAGQSATLSRPYFLLPFPLGSHDEAGQGRYTLALLDAQGQVLVERAFDVVGDSIDPLEGDGAFSEILLWHTDTAQIVIKEGEGVLHSHLVSDHTPEVTVLAPNGGEHWLAYGPYTIAWSGQDQDENPLRYVVQYSADDGASWQTLATNLSGTSYQVEAGRLAGSLSGRVRVIASDGVLTAMDMSDGVFSVDAKPPQVTIVQPAPGAIVNPGAPLLLRAMASDGEDGPAASDASFGWTSSVDGALGQGSWLQISDLTPGRHQLTAAWTDSDGFTGLDSVTIQVGYADYLPLIQRAP